MGKSHLLMLGFILASGSLFAGCSDATTDGGSGGGAGKAGASSAGSTSAGEGGEAGSADTTPKGPLNPQGVIVPAEAPAKLNHLLVTGTDFAQTELVSVAVDKGTVTKGETYADSDVVTVSSAGVGFALERTNDKLHIIENGKSTATVDLTEVGSDTAAIDNKAYVPFLNKSAIAIVDLGDGKVSRRIDLSAYDVAADTDKSVDVAGGVYDPTAKVAYFILQRIDRNTIVSPEFQLACATAAALVIGIDTTTDELVDLNGSATGKAIELKLANPGSVAINADGSALYVLSAGCYEAGKLKSQGVEVVDPSDGSSTVAYAPEGEDYLAQLILTKGSDALLGSFDSAGATHWNTLDIAKGDLVGAELKDVPQAVTYDGTDLLGVQVLEDTTVGSVVRYDIATGALTPISDSSWAGDYSVASSSALVE
ncbi:MAG: hypothetical protein ABW061_11125 [Polyangiaceae bacterium]